MANQNHNRAYSAADRNRQAGMQVESDPLAELARLIGQTEPLYGRTSQPAPEPHSPRSQFRPSAPAHHAADDEPESAGPQRAAGPPSWMLTRATPQKPVQATHSDDTHPLRRYANSQPMQPQSYYEPPQRHHDAEHEFAPAASERYDDALYGPADDESDSVAHQDQFDAEYQQDPSGYQDDYGYEAEVVEKPRRGGLKTVIAVLALAVVGTGAAFGYRTYVGAPRSGEPPIIKADAGPNKVVPPSAASENSSKQIQDRLAAGNDSEQIVSREEQPVDVKDIAQSGPRVVFPSLNQNANPPTTASVAPNARLPANSANGIIAGSEPRKIKTVTVRPDRPDPAAKPTVAAQQPAPTAAAPRAAHVAAAPSSNAPLSLAPQGEARTQIASSNPAQSIPVTTGGYVVQISSQRNEADARASFRVLQGKFPSSLGSRSPLFKRADLGPKGVYYRAMVGPFGSSDEAVHFCNGLKAAGGQCVVQRN